MMISYAFVQTNAVMALSEINLFLKPFKYSPSKNYGKGFLSK